MDSVPFIAHTEELWKIRFLFFLITRSLGRNAFYLLSPKCPGFVSSLKIGFARFGNAPYAWEALLFAYLSERIVFFHT